MPPRSLQKAHHRKTHQACVPQAEANLETKPRPIRYLTLPRRARGSGHRGRKAHPPGYWDSAADNAAGRAAVCELDWAVDSCECCSWQPFVSGNTQNSIIAQDRPACPPGLACWVCGATRCLWTSARAPPHPKWACHRRFLRLQTPVPSLPLCICGPPQSACH